MLQIGLPSIPLQAEVPIEADPPRAWGIATRAGFRFAFVYLALCFFPGPLELVERLTPLFRSIDSRKHELVGWFATHVLQLEQPLHFANTGSGDTTALWVENLMVLLVAVTAALLWTVFERGHKNHARLHQWVRLGVRLELGAILLGYGAIKVIKAQFPDPFLWRLLEPYGDSSPMGLLWTFMGYSKGYNAFTGGVEMAAGALVLAPGLTGLGALLALCSMVNVFVLNMTYDVPVKLYSLNLILLSLFLLAPEARRLADFFLFNRATRPAEAARLFASRSLNRAMAFAQVLFLAYASVHFIQSGRHGIRQYGDLSPKPALYGMYNVDRFTVDGQDRPPLFTDPLRWKRVTIERDMMGVLPGDGPVQRYAAETWDASKTLRLTRRGDAEWETKLAFETPAPGKVRLKGTMDGKLIVAELSKMDEGSFNLTSRGFHWINEYPYNR
jgi:hypothetical protein